MAAKIGIYPGTFDPIHSGHIAFAQKSAEVCHLDKVIFLPEANPRYKQNATNITHRVHLIKIGTASIKNLDVLRVKSAQFTARQTMPELQKHLGHAQLTLLLGSDTFKTLPHWDELDKLLGQFHLAIGLRGNDKDADISKIIRKIEKDNNLTVDFTLLPAPEPLTSSSQARNNTAKIHPSLRTYANKYDLYD